METITIPTIKAVMPWNRRQEDNSRAALSRPEVWDSSYDAVNDIKRYSGGRTERNIRIRGEVRPMLQ